MRRLTFTLTAAAMLAGSWVYAQSLKDELPLEINIKRASGQSKSKSSHCAAVMGAAFF